MGSNKGQSAGSNRGAARALQGQTIASVSYYLLSVDEGLEDWDFGAWHQPTMGWS